MNFQLYGLHDIKYGGPGRLLRRSKDESSRKFLLTEQFLLQKKNEL